MNHVRHLFSGAALRTAFGALLSAAMVTSATAQAPLIPPGMIGDPGPITSPVPKGEPRALTPPAPQAEPDPDAISKARPKARPRPTTRPAATHPAPAEPAPSEAAAAEPVALSGSGREPDIAYGAYQRGYYLTAFLQATKRVEAQSDTKSMTLLGELYANGLGVLQDDNKAAEWYQLAAKRGDREAMFALAMFRMAGRGGPVNREETARLFAAAAKLGHIAAAYNLALFYLEGQLFPQDFARAAQLFRAAAEAGSPEAQYALGTLYKEGRGVPKKDVNEAARWLAAASAADYTDAQVEYAIALFNGTGVPKNEAAAAALLKRAARKGSPIAQNRLAQVFAFGRGVPADPVEAIKWHLVSKAGGASDILLDDFVGKQKPEVRAAGEKAARPWVDAIKPPRS
jgi:TPR repeat protein